MCKLYTLLNGPAAILDLARAITNHVGNFEPGDVYRVSGFRRSRTGRVLEFAGYP
jgi:hypothetical protein